MFVISIGYKISYFSSSGLISFIFFMISLRWLDWIFPELGTVITDITANYLIMLIINDYAMREYKSAYVN